jgi:hypothetical protein
MRRLHIFILFLSFATGFPIGAAPANDDFANRIFLQGSSVLLSANMEGATRETEELQADPYSPWLGSAWWSWTAPATGPVIIQVLKVVRPTPLYGSQDRAYVGVWSPSNLGSGFPTIDLQSPQRAISLLDFDPGSLGHFLVFTSYVGNSYQIQLGVMTPGSTYTLALTATNAPLIFGQPRDARIAPGQCAVFTVDAAGVLPLNYQWQFNGEAMIGANSSFYGITNGTLGQAGDYSVVVSNATGISTSLVAHLWVTQDEVAPSVNAMGVNPSSGFQFTLQGEAGRFYRIETSANLRDWRAEPSFPWDTRIDSYPYTRPLTSIVYPTNLPAVFSIPATNTTRFLRVARYSPSNEVCNLFLEQIQHAKRVWARETGHTLMDYAGDVDIFKVPDAKPVCPAGGFYSPGYIGRSPICTYGHVLEEPR